MEVLGLFIQVLCGVLIAAIFIRIIFSFTRAGGEIVGRRWS